MTKVTDDLRLSRRSVLAGAAGSALLGSRSAQAQSTPIRIAVLGDMGGATGGYSGKESFEAARMAAEEFGNNIAGMPVDVISVDHQNKPDLASSLARELYDVRGVDALVNVSNSSAAVAVAEVARRKQRIALFSSPGTNALTNEACNPYTIHWTFNTDSLASSIVSPLIEGGQKDWFLLVADYAFGHALERTVTQQLKQRGGTLVGAVKHPFLTTDISSYTLQAASSKAKVIGLANSTADTTNSIKSMHEFGVLGSGKEVVAFTVLITDIHAVGLDVAKGLKFAEAFYWDRDEKSREWSRRFQGRAGRMPNMVNAGDYSATRHYLAAIRDLGDKSPEKVIERMKATPVNDAAFRNGTIRPDGLHVHDMLLCEVKKPSESTGPWDYYHIRGIVPADVAYPPLSESRCKL